MITIRVFESPDSFFEKTYSPDTVINIGRSEACDLVLRSKRISRNHCRIVFTEGNWSIQDEGSQNGFRLNGTRTTAGLLSHGDRLDIGDFRLEIHLPQAKTDTPLAQGQDPDLDRTVLCEPDPDLDKTVLSNVPPVLGTTPPHAALKPAKQSFLSSTPGKILMGVGGAFCLLFLVLAIIAVVSKKEPEPEKAVVAEETKKTEAMMDMETRHKIDFYLQSGTEQYNTGRYNEALVRFQSVLSLDPTNTTAQGYITSIRDRLNELEQQRQAAAREEQERMARVNEIIASTRQAMSRSEYEQANSLIAEAAFLAPGNTSVQELKTEIASTLEKKKKARETEKIRMTSRLEELKQNFDEGQRLYNQGDFHQALEAWEKVLAMGIESPETAHIRSAIPHVKKAMEDSVQEDYNKGLLCYQKKEFAAAAEYFSKVDKAFPGYKDTATLLQNSVGDLEATAKALFQEGLVYEGIGQRQKAEEKWRQVLKTIPIESNTYYQRAKNKLQ